MKTQDDYLSPEAKHRNAVMAAGGTADDDDAAYNAIWRSMGGLGIPVLQRCDELSLRLAIVKLIVVERKRGQAALAEFKSEILNMFSNGEDRADIKAMCK